MDQTVSSDLENAALSPRERHLQAQVLLFPKDRHNIRGHFLAGRALNLLVSSSTMQNRNIPSSILSEHFARTTRLFGVVLEFGKSIFDGPWRAYLARNLKLICQQENMEELLPLDHLCECYPLSK